MRDLFAALAVTDPYTVYAQLRELDQPLRLSAREVVFARHADVMTVLHDERFGRPKVRWLPVKAARVLFRMFLMLDPPDHTRLRRRVSPFFAPASIAGLRAAVMAEARRLLAGRESIEVMADFAYPLPLTVISRLLGVPHQERLRINRWSRTLTDALDSPIPVRARDVLRYLKATATRRTHPVAVLRAATGIVAYARQRLRDPDQPEGAELLALLRQAVNDRALHEDDAVATWVLLVIAGHETTANLVGNGLHALLRHPEHLASLRGDPAIAPSVVEECLRYDSPVPLAGRVAKADVSVGDRVVRRGTTAYVLIGAANRDPSVFPHPDTFNVTRQQKPAHLAFGHGIHFCLGAALARLEAEAAFLALAQRQPSLVSAEWRSSFAVRGLSSLHITLSP